ncbi:MAG TPA: PKD domain-containing protein [Sphingomonas sp.]|nr:PKD domain-containing protein [Sphingomonas sp.]
MMRGAPGLALLGVLAFAGTARAQAPAGTVFPIYQFPADQIPRVDGNADDWAPVRGDYVIGSDKLAADDGSGRRPDPASLSVSVRVGWVKGLNRLYFLYEATDDYWDFAAPGLHQDIFELVVDGDRSGGPLIARFHPDMPGTPGRDGTVRPNGPVPPSVGVISDGDAWFRFQNAHAQNYHIFTPARDKDWAMAWGPQAWWIKSLPWSNIAYHYDFAPGQPGKLTMEFWITPFDHASADGPEHSVETTLVEGKLLGMSWAVIDSDGPGAKTGGFWNLSAEHVMYGQASYLRAFRLMPLEPRYVKPIEAHWSFRILDVDRRVVAFNDQSMGKVTGWRWDFGDGQVSTEQHPIHRYTDPGKFVVTLDVTGPGGASRLSRVWDVSFTADPPK